MSDVSADTEGALRANPASAGGQQPPNPSRGAPGQRGLTAASRRFARAYLVVLFIPAMLIFFGLKAPNTFFTKATMETLLTTNSALLVLVVGLTLTLVVGEFDLSFSGLVGMTGAFIVGVHGVGVGGALVISLLAAIAIGLVNAFFVIILGVSSIIATLGMGTVTAGIGLALTQSETVPNPYLGFGDVLTYTVGGIGVVFLAALLALAILWGVLDRTRWGRNAYFVGAGRRAATYAGINANRTRLIALVISAVASWLAGLILFGQSGSASASFGSGYLLDVIAASMLGYTAIRPGRYNALGSLVGMLVLAIGTTGIEVLAAPIWLTDVFSGSILFIAVGLANVLGSGKGLRSLRSAVE